MFITYFASWPLYFSVDTYLEGHLGEQFISNVSLVEQDLALSESSKNEVLEEEVSRGISILSILGEVRNVEI